MSQHGTSRPRVVVIGGGFGGLHAARGLRKSPVNVLLIDKVNYHLFQPLLYQVATGSLAPNSIAVPIRRVFRRQKNVTAKLATVEAIDLDAKLVRTEDSEHGFDYLVLACGVNTSYFGHPEFRAHAPGLKDLDDALDIRRRVLLAFEEAEFEMDEASRLAKLTFVVVGGGPTGVELAGALAEAARLTLPHDFRYIDTRTTQVLLIEGGPRLLPTFPEKLSGKAQRDLESQGVEVRLNSFVTHVDEAGVQVGDRRIPAQNVLWAAGVQGSPLIKQLGEVVSGGRIEVRPDLSLPGQDRVFVIGDAANVVDAKGQEVPGVAQGAIQMGQFVSRVIARDVSGTPAAERPAFRYRDKGAMAVISRGRAVADIRGWNLGGFWAWLAWAFIHIFFLVGFRRKVIVFLEWVWSFLFYVRGTRLITGNPEVQITASRSTTRTDDIS